MNYDRLIEWFFKECPEVVEQMKNSNHHYDEKKGILNPYHMEGDVLTHTLMVVQQAESRDMPEYIKYAALFHDFGKPECRGVNHEKQRVSFYNHDAYSAFKSIYYMKQLGISKEMMLRIFKVVSLHTDMYRCDPKSMKTYIKKYKKDPELLLDIQKLAICDGMGRFTDPSISPRAEGCVILQDYVNKIMLEQEKPVKEDKKNNAIAMIGLPMSGKSTWINNFLKDNPNYVVASRDDIIMELAKDKSYNEAYASVNSDEVNKLFRERVEKFVKEGKDIIFDLTNMSKKWRRKTLSMLNKDYSKTAQVVLSDLQTLKERNEHRTKKEGKTIPWSALEQMIKSFHPPMYDEFDEINYEIN